MADDRLGRVAKSRARRNGAAGPVDVFGQRNSEPANAIKEFASAEHVSSPCKTLLLYVGFEVEREHTLEEIGQGADKEKKLIIGFKGKDKSLVCNRTNAQTIAEVTGKSDTDDWPGHRIILTARDVDFQGRTMLAIRVSLKKPATAAAAAKPAPVAAPVDDFDDVPL